MNTLTDIINTLTDSLNNLANLGYLEAVEDALNNMILSARMCATIDEFIINLNIMFDDARYFIANSDSLAVKRYGEEYMNEIKNVLSLFDNGQDDDK